MTVCVKSTHIRARTNEPNFSSDSCIPFVRYAGLSLAQQARGKQYPYTDAVFHNGYPRVLFDAARVSESFRGRRQYLRALLGLLGASYRASSVRVCLPADG